MHCVGRSQNRREGPLVGRPVEEAEVYGRVPVAGDLGLFRLPSCSFMFTAPMETEPGRLSAADTRRSMGAPIICMWIGDICGDVMQGEGHTSSGERRRERTIA